ncbi:MAG TPA: HAD family hydrolase [Rhodocyclaceae bacterium]|nr:HAD family hydrolase [Rhodocyclaceae bacterium]
MMKLLICDLDNTLYDWVSFFSSSFGAMVARLSDVLEVPQERLLDEFKDVHQKYHNSEHPFALFEIATVQERFGNYTRSQLKEKFDDALHEFNRNRKLTLRLYPGVLDTLNELRRQGVTIVGHTEAIAVNAYFRLRTLKIDHFFKHLYAIDSILLPHPSSNSDSDLKHTPPDGFLQLIPREEKKPNPKLLIDICQREGISPSEAVYIGDSLTRDMSMAKSAGVTAAWAKYGTEYDRQLWNLLVRITHWTAEDVRREEDLKLQYANVRPDLVINSFADLLQLQ